jgi:class 3 adenylate cyclase
MAELPSGAVTFLFSDIEGSTRLLKVLRDLYPQVLADHRELFRAAIARQAGHEVSTEGDAFFVAFASAKRAVLCALEVQQALAAHEWPDDGRVRVRMGIHTGQAVPDQGDYTGMAVHRAARICSAARGGQVLVSQATQNLVEVPLSTTPSPSRPSRTIRGRRFWLTPRLAARTACSTSGVPPRRPRKPARRWSWPGRSDTRPAKPEP